MRRDLAARRAEVLARLERLRARKRRSCPGCGGEGLQDFEMNGNPDRVVTLLCEEPGCLRAAERASESRYERWMEER